jgi:hypothetical protein
MRENPTPMQSRSYANSKITTGSVKQSAQQRSAPTRDDLTRLFNTALVSSQAETKRDFSAELCELTESAPFKAILNAVRQLSVVQGTPERQAAEEIIKTFRRMDEVWSEYIFREGLDRLRGNR